MAYARVAKVVSEGMPGTTSIVLDDGRTLINVQTVKWEIAGKDNLAIVTLELDGVDIEVNDKLAASYKKYTDKIPVKESA